jgi:hypothetical protein
MSSPIKEPNECAAIEDVRAAIDDLREASPITSFGSVLFGAF